MRARELTAASLVASMVAAVSCAARETPPPRPPTPPPAREADAVTTAVAEPEADTDRLPDTAVDPVMLELMRETRKAFAALDVGGYRVIVEGTEARARSVAKRTVEPVSERLSKQYFEKSPRRGIRLVLFTSDATYRKGAAALTGEEPDTPFGFYSSELSAVIMNLSTGGETLVHEMVHTFTETDFPEMPAWFNEGLASLYEQCRFEPWGLAGLTNWRLPALQDALREEMREDADAGHAKGLLARVVATSTDEFYGRGSGLNYAVARYLCYDLQQENLLERFYKEFRRESRAASREGRRPTDPTGRKVLEKLLGTTLDRYEPGWRERTLKLRFPERR
ncbi:MAG: hypothetical protein ACYTKD_15745 [Planctomycetota bacterium]|jgi:hypothetical protein